MPPPMMIPVIIITASKRDSTGRGALLVSAGFIDVLRHNKKPRAGGAARHPGTLLAAAGDLRLRAATSQHAGELVAAHVASQRARHALVVVERELDFIAPQGGADK